LARLEEHWADKGATAQCPQRIVVPETGGPVDGALPSGAEDFGLDRPGSRGNRWGQGDALRRRGESRMTS
jgi:hypothetical protein